MRKTYQVTEYGSFVRDKEVTGCTSLPQDTTTIAILPNLLRNLPKSLQQRLHLWLWDNIGYKRDRITALSNPCAKMLYGSK